MIKIKKIQPLFTALITTMDKYKETALTKGGLLDITKKEDTLKEYQTVLAVGSAVRDIKVGDLVSVNPSRFAKKKHQEGSMKDGIITDNPIITYNFNTVEMDGKQCLLLQNNDIDFVIEEWDPVEIPEPSTIIEPESSKLIVPDNSIIL